MPRTKRPAARARKGDQPDTPEEAAARRALHAIVEEHKKAIDNRAEMEIKQIEMAFKILLNSMDERTKQMTIGQLKQETRMKEALQSSTTNHTTARSASHDDEGSTHGSGSRGATTRRTSRSATRLADHSDHVGAATLTQQRRRSRSVEQSAFKQRPPRSAFKQPSVYKTPACSKGPNMFPPITPKIMPNAPMPLLRRPRQGEMVVSMSGSPIMMPITQMEKANCNIPLCDGTLLSLQPENLRQSSTFIPFSLMDSDVLCQLKTLKKNLNTVIQLGEQKGKM